MNTKKNITPLLFGVIFILAGLAYLASMIFGWHFTIFFDGWWTLFIIIPSFVSMLANGPRIFTVSAFFLGGLLLLSAQGFIPYRYFGILLVAFIIISIGVGMIAHFIRGPRTVNQYAQFNSADHGNSFAQGSYQYTASNNGSTSNADTNTNADDCQNFSNTNYSANGSIPNYNAVMSSLKEKNTSTDFLGARVSSIMGSVELDLRNATLTRDVTVFVSTIMGGATIFAPQNVRIVISKSDIAGTTNCTAMTMPQDANVPVVSFNCSTVMGCITIK